VSEDGGLYPEFVPEDLETRRFRKALAVESAPDQEKLRATACYAAGRCQYDLGCPLMAACREYMYGTLSG
jgi:hypothetical protein